MKRTKEQMASLREDMIGRKVAEIIYDEQENYYIIVFDNGTEVAVRFMADIKVEE